MSQNTLKENIELLRFLAGLGRQIVSFWRAKIFFQKEDSFIEGDTVKKRLYNLSEHGLITPIKTGKGSMWKANTPYLKSTNNIYELANEAYPLACLSYSTALEVLNITDQRFNTIHLLEPRDSISNIPQEPDIIRSNVVPPDTQLNDWQINDAPARTNIQRAWNNYTISPHKTKNTWIFGTTIQEVQGVKVRTTSLERTLVDGLKIPDNCGGLNEVFKAWVRTLNDIHIDHIVEYTERYDSSILYQRVGYVCETLGLNHKRFAHWKTNHTPRGGSRLLNPYKEYKKRHDKNWNLSINHPVAILENKDADYS